jgi:DNA mismatch repair protein MSH4
MDDSQDFHIPPTGSRPITAINNTGHSRLATATSRRPATQSQAPFTQIARANLVIVLVENKIREVGAAIVDTNRIHSVELMHTPPDSPGFNHVISMIRVLRPQHIVLCSSQLKRTLALKILSFLEEENSGDDGGQSAVKMCALPRNAFDENKGKEQLQRIRVSSSLVKEEEEEKIDIGSCYLGLCALNALHVFLDQELGLSVAPRSVAVSWKNMTEDRLLLDFETVINLELVSGSRSGSKSDSLFGMLDRTSTGPGSRLLFSNILAPPNKCGTIEMRQEAVQELLQRDTVRRALISVLPRLLDIDMILHALVAQTKGETTIVIAKTIISAVIALKHTLDLLPQISSALERVQNPLLQAVRSSLFSDVLSSLRAMIDEVVTEDTTWSRSPLQREQQECFAVIPGIDGNLDMMRTIYSESVATLYSLAENLRAEWNLPQLKLHFTKTRGFHLQVPLVALQPPVTDGLGIHGKGGNTRAGKVGADPIVKSEIKLPASAIQVVQTKNLVTMTTLELISLNERAHASQTQVYTITANVVQGLVSKIRQRGMTELLQLTESIALIDMIVSFATLASLSTDSSPYCKPILDPTGTTLSIYQGRHPIIEHVTGGPVSRKSIGSEQRFRFVPNDLTLGPDITLKVLTGPNCSGKSTYLRQTALLVVMSHLGSFIPAERAVFSMTDRLLTRLSTGDDENASTFLKEMRETSYLISNATRKSLVLIDELGRGTSNEDGVGIAWSVCEHLITRDIRTLIVTHYHELARLSSLYSNAENCCMAVDVADDAGSMSFKYSCQGGASNSNLDYGIALAEMCGLPADLVSDARALRDVLKGQLVSTTKKKKKMMMMKMTSKDAMLIDEDKGQDIIDEEDIDNIKEEEGEDGDIVGGVNISSADATVVSRLRLARRLVQVLLPSLDAQENDLIVNGAPIIDNVGSLSSFSAAIDAARDEFGGLLSESYFSGTGRFFQGEVPVILEEEVPPPTPLPPSTPSFLLSQTQKPKSLVFSQGKAPTNLSQGMPHNADLDLSQGMQHNEGLDHAEHDVYKPFIGLDISQTAPFSSSPVTNRSSPRPLMMLQAPQALMESGPPLKTIYSETTNTNDMLLEGGLVTTNDQVMKIEEEDNSWETLETALKGLF